MKEALEEYYKLLYDGEAIFPILKVQDLPLCEKSEKAYPGFFSMVIFLKAAEHFEKYLHENGFDKLSYDFMDTYYKNIRRFMEMNHVRDNTYALVRLGYCLYGYSKPFVLRIGRLAYELRQFDATVFNVFEDECSKMVFIKNPETEINNIGYPMTEGKIKDYKEGFCFDRNGNVSSHIKNLKNKEANMLGRLKISNEILAKYEKEANETFDCNFVNKERVLNIAKEAKLCDENIKLISDFMDFADDDIKRFIWLFYYLQFESDEDFSDNHWALDDIPMPDRSEKPFPGCIKSVTYLLTVENLKKWVSDRGLSYDIVEGYYGRYKTMVNYNIISHNTYGLCRLSPFLYGYSKPYIFCIGRLIFQRTPFKDYANLYENNKGERIFIALPNYSYNEKGLQDKDADFVPTFEEYGDKICGYRFKKDGTLSMKKEEFDLTEYRLLYKSGDTVVTIHIPESGGKLTKETVRETFKLADDFLRKYIPEFKTYVCQTWFIDPALRGEVIRDGSNMADFADIFDVICGPDNNNHSVFEHVFKTNRRPLDELKPENGFQERVLERAKRGEKIYWSFGVLKNDYNLYS